MGPADNERALGHARSRRAGAHAHSSRAGAGRVVKGACARARPPAGRTSTPAGRLRTRTRARTPGRVVKGAWDLHFIAAVGPNEEATSALIQRLILFWMPSMVGFRLLVKESMKPYA